jgi:DNA replication and repair protein RecF
MHTYLSKLTLLNFKNYEDTSLEFCRKINCFTGYNGVGKTNILDAIYYLSLCKSFFGNSDSLNILHQHDFFVIQGEYLRDEGKENIYCGVKVGQKKSFRRNGKEYDRLAEHIGLLPVVMISPADSSLILEGSEERRKFMDSVISQFDPVYLDDLIRYNKALAQRNQLLKDFNRRNWYDADMLEMWNDQLTATGTKIFEKRKVFVSEMIPVFQQYYEFVSEGAEKVSLEYESHLFEEDYPTLFARTHERDRILQYTSAGIHKDDLNLHLSNYPIKRIGSQGQQKTYLVALKLAQFDFIKQHLHTLPILLLDDIFDKFDEKRVATIVKLVASDRFGQIFITDTHNDRMKDILTGIGSEYHLFKINSPENIEKQ